MPFQLIPVPHPSAHRKRPALDDALNRPQKPSVLPAPDATILVSDRTLANLLDGEMHTRVRDGGYFEDVQNGAVNARVREMAVDWLYDVSCRLHIFEFPTIIPPFLQLSIEERCEQDVFPLAVALLDRFLSVQAIFREHVQTVASVCLFIAAKVKAPQPMNAKTIAYYTDGGVRVQEILVSLKRMRDEQ